MTGPKDDEEALLRSVALQNAQSILLARQRAEDELLRAKEALERKTQELANSLGVLSATLESTTDGILVTDSGGNVTASNQKFIDMWQIPPDIMALKEHGHLQKLNAQHFRDPAQFVARIRAIYETSPPESYDLLELVDGRVIERFSRIQVVSGQNAGRVWSFRDITERRRAEEAVQKQSEWLRVTLSSIGDAVLTTDTEARVTSLNRIAESLTGWTDCEAQGQPLDRVFHIVSAESREPIESPAARALQEGKAVGLESHTVLVATDGTERSIDHSAAPIQDERGATIGVVVIFRDVTESRPAMEARLLLSAIVESSDDAIISKNLEGTIVSWNQGAARLYGYTAEEVVGKPLSILIPPDHEDELPAIMERLKRGERIQRFETKRMHKNGTPIEVSVSISPVRGTDGRIIGASKIARDITASKQVERTTRFLADASAALVELTDADRTLQKVADLAVPGFADWCTADVQDADGTVRRVGVVHRDPEKLRLADELFRRFPPRPSDAHGVIKVLRAGTVEWVATVSDSMVMDWARDDEHGRILRLLGLKSLISVPLYSRKGILGALTFATAESGRIYTATDVAAAEDLAHRVVIAMENASLLSALKESDRRKDEFLAILAHELRNPLAPIRNAVLIHRAQSLPTPELQWATKVIDRQVRQMTRLVDDLLDVSRITTGKIELRKEWIELATVVNSALEISQPIIEKWGHKLTIEVPTQPILIEADPTRLTQVFVNLLNNAAKYMESGGRIWLIVEQQKGHVLIRVKDAGIGITREMLPRVFDMFTQGDRSVERSQGGLGIGLTLVQRLVELHGGTVEVRSDGPAKGSEFVVRLAAPMIGDRAPEGAASDSEKRSAPAGLRILVVDDNHDSADSLGMLLRIMGNDVQTAHDGLQAVEAAAEFHPDVVLLDIGLPKLNGYEAARRIRTQEGGADIVLVALTGWGQEEDRRRSKEAGFDHHLTKPVELATLRAVLAKSNIHPHRR